MKPGIHPKYHTINVVMTDGTKYETRSTWGKEGDTMTLDVDSKSHPAWIGGATLRKTGQMEKFANKFGTFGAKTAKADGAATAEAKTETKTAKKKDDKKA